MGFYTRISFQVFGTTSEKILPFFPDLKADLKKARMKISSQEYLSKSLMTSLIVFLIEVPLLSFIFGFLGYFLFSLITSFTLSIFFSAIIFFLCINYPKAIIQERAKKLESTLPFASLYLSTIAGTKLPLHKTFEMFARFSKYGEITQEISMITDDIELFGLDVNSALERAVERTPSKNFKELLWGLLTTSLAGGRLDVYLKERAKNFMEDYRRKLYEFSRKITVFIEIYLTAIVLGTIFFVILTSIISGIAETGANMLLLQSFLIFLFLPIISTLFIFLVKASYPGGE